MSPCALPAILLAAGASRRMGTPKALLPWGGRPIVTCLVEVLLGGGASRVLVVIGRADQRLPPVLAGARRVEVVFNEVPERGPLGSIQAALGRLPRRAPAVLVAPVDQPALRSETVARLLAAWAETRAAIIVPVHSGRRGHPTIFRRDVFPELLAADPARGARAVVEHDPARVREHAVDDPAVLQNLNTPADLAQALGRGIESSSPEGKLG